MFFFNLFFTFCGCSNKENKKNIEPLILTKKNNTSSALKLNGIYILTFNVPFNSEFYGVVENSFILYNNGQVIILGGGGVLASLYRRSKID